jgi:hypothetical protein
MTTLKVAEVVAGVAEVVAGVAEVVAGVAGVVAEVVAGVVDTFMTTLKPVTLPLLVRSTAKLRSAGVSRSL